MLHIEQKSDNVYRYQFIMIFFACQGWVHWRLSLAELELLLIIRGTESSRLQFLELNFRIILVK